MALHQKMCFKLDVEQDVAVLETSLEIIGVVLRCINDSTVTRSQNLEANIIAHWCGHDSVIGIL